MNAVARKRIRPLTSEHAAIVKALREQLEAAQARLAAHPRYCGLALCIGLVVGLVCGRAWL